MCVGALCVCGCALCVCERCVCDPVEHRRLFSYLRRMKKKEAQLRRKTVRKRQMPVKARKSTMTPKRIKGRLNHKPQLRPQTH